MSQETIRRLIHPEVKVLSEKDGTVQYIASDETLDVYREIVSAKGWLFDYFKKNSPFVDSHDYSSISKVLGRVQDWNITGNKLIETVQWAKDIPQSLADWGFKMTAGGFLKAVSVGFWPTKMVTKWDADKTGWLNALKEKDAHEEDGVTVIYLQQQQVELSACVLGANPNAVAKAFKAGCLSEEDIDKMETLISRAQLKDADAERAKASGAARSAKNPAANLALAMELRRLANR